MSLDVPSPAISMQERVAGWVAAYESGRREVDERLARREREIAARVRRIKASLEPPSPVPQPTPRPTAPPPPPPPAQAPTFTWFDPIIVRQERRIVGVGSHQAVGGVEVSGQTVRCARCGKYYTGGTGAVCGTV